MTKLPTCRPKQSTRCLFGLAPALALALALALTLCLGCNFGSALEEDRLQCAQGRCGGNSELDAGAERDGRAASAEGSRDLARASTGDSGRRKELAPAKPGAPTKPGAPIEPGGGEAGDAPSKAAGTADGGKATSVELSAPGSAHAVGGKESTGDATPPDEPAHDRGRLTELQLSTFGFSLHCGQEQALELRGVYEDGSTEDLTAVAQWASNDPQVVKVESDERVLATARYSGMADIIATVDGMQASTSVTVTCDVIETLIIEPPPKDKLNVGDAMQLRAVGTWSWGATSDVTQILTWNSSDPAAIRVAADGSVTVPLDAPPGAMATITATLDAGRVSDSVTLQVAETTPDGPSEKQLVIEVDGAVGPSAAVECGSVALSAHLLDSTGAAQDVTELVQWQSSDPDVLRLRDHGAAWAPFRGRATVTASLDGVVAMTEVVASCGALVKLEVSPENFAFGCDTEVDLRATATFADGSTLDATPSVTWETGDPAVVTVDNKGVAWGVDSGSAEISATLDGLEAAALATVHCDRAVSLSVTPDTPVLSLGSELQLTALAHFPAGSVRDVSRAVGWISSDPEFFPITDEGLLEVPLHAQPNSSAEVTATWGDLSESTTIRISTAYLVGAIEVTVTPPQLPLGLSVSPTATAHLSDGSAVDVTRRVDWESSSDVAAVSWTDGQPWVAGQAIGQASISARAVGLPASTAGSAQLGVWPRGGPLTIVQRDGAAEDPIGTATLRVGDRSQLMALGFDDDGRAFDIAQAVTWSVQQPTECTDSADVGDNVLDATGLAGQDCLPAGNGLWVDVSTASRTEGLLTAHQSTQEHLNLATPLADDTPFFATVTASYSGVSAVLRVAVTP